MSFIKKKSHEHKTSGKTTRWIDLGTTEAEGEKEKLKVYFEDFLNITDQISNGKYILTGRKGVGKSAYVQYLLNHDGEENEMYCKFIPRDTVVLEKMIHAVPDSVGSKNEVIFEWIILTSIASLLLRHNDGRYTDEYDD